MARTGPRTLTAVAALALALCLPSCSSNEGSTGASVPAQLQQSEPFGFIRVQIFDTQQSSSDLVTSAFRLEDEIAHVGIDGMATTLVVLVAEDAGGECQMEFDLSSAERFGPPESESWLELHAADYSENDQIETNGGPLAGICNALVRTGTLHSADSGLELHSEVWVSPQDTEPSTLLTLQDSLEEYRQGTDLRLVTFEP